MKKTVLYIFAAVAAMMTSCSDEMDVVIPHIDNITFEELAPGRFATVIPDGGFSCGGINFNTVKSGSQLAGGFCYSSRSYRSMVRDNNENAIDSMRYSVYTVRPNTTGTYVVCRVNGDDAYFTLDRPQVIDFMLVGNTTWNYFGMYYGDEFTGANPGTPSKPQGTWHTYIPGGAKKFAAGDYLNITAKGFRNGAQTGQLTFDLACKKGHNTENPTWDYLVTNWWRWDLAELGEVDKVVFYMDSSDKDAEGNMRTPAWFCIDGVKFQK